jgi:hypothetical protein
MNTKEKKLVEIKMRYAFMLGYQRGYHDALPMDKFVGTLMELMDPRTMKNVEKWAKKQIIDNKYPKCTGCARSSHNAHCALAYGNCKNGSMFVKR